MAEPLLSPISNGASKSMRVQDGGSKKDLRGKGQGGKKKKRMEGRERLKEGRKEEGRNKSRTGSSSRDILRHLEAFPQPILNAQAET